MSRQDILLSDLRRDCGTQFRAADDADTVQRYADAYERGDDMPPPDVFVLPDGSIVVAEGFRRIAAVELLGWPSIECEAHHGTLREATIFALKSNSRHGVPWSPRDNENRVAKALELFPDWSDRRIAEELTLSPTTVGRIRAKLEHLSTPGQTSQVSSVDRRSFVKKDGTEGTVDVSSHRARKGEKRGTVATPPDRSAQAPSLPQIVDAAAVAFADFDAERELAESKERVRALEEQVKLLSIAGEDPLQVARNKLAEEILKRQQIEARLRDTQAVVTRLDGDKVRLEREMAKLRELFGVKSKKFEDLLTAVQRLVVPADAD